MPLVYIPVYKEQPPVPISAFFCVSRSKHRLITGHSAPADCVRLSSERIPAPRHTKPILKEFRKCVKGHVSASELDSDR